MNTNTNLLVLSSCHFADRPVRSKHAPGFKNSKNLFHELEATCPSMPHVMSGKAFHPWLILSVLGKLGP